MRDYELIIIIHPDQDETAVNALIEKVKGWLKDSGGAVQEVENWADGQWLMRSRKNAKAIMSYSKCKWLPVFLLPLNAI